MAQLRSHELHIKLDYRLRSRVLALATLTILLGAVMLFAGLHGSFDWAFEAPHAISAKLTNASPGIVFATIGMILVFVVVLLPPIKFQSGNDGTLAIYHPLPLGRQKRLGR
jgi:ABC-type sulfate transport system permease subunit